MRLSTWYIAFKIRLGYLQMIAIIFHKIDYLLVKTILLLFNLKLSELQIRKFLVFIIFNPKNKWSVFFLFSYLKKKSQFFLNSWYLSLINIYWCQTEINIVVIFSFEVHFLFCIFSATTFKSSFDQVSLKKKLLY